MKTPFHCPRAAHNEFPTSVKAAKCEIQKPSTFCACNIVSLQQMFLLRDKLIAQGEKRETSTKTYNEKMLRDKLRVFVSRISPPLHVTDSYAYGP